MRKAVYAGSFDPITNGHIWMIKQGTKLFDKLVVAIGVNPEKGYTFTVEERLKMIKNAIKDHQNVTVDCFENQFLVNYAASINAQYILRGIRSQADYEYERGMRQVNGDFRSGVSTVFLMPPREYAEVSSSLVKGLIGPLGWQDIVKTYVPKSVFQSIVEKNKNTP